MSTELAIKRNMWGKGVLSSFIETQNYEAIKWIIQPPAASVVAAQWLRNWTQNTGFKLQLSNNHT